MFISFSFNFLIVYIPQICNFKFADTCNNRSVFYRPNKDF